VASAGIEKGKISVLSVERVFFGKAVFLPDTSSARVLSFSNWTVVKNGQSLYEYDRVRTDPSSRLEIRLKDQNRFILEQNSEVELVQNSTPPKVFLSEGKLVSLSFLSIESGEGTIISGSGQFTVEKKGNVTKIAVYKGKATVSAEGKTVTLGENHGTRVKAGYPPEPVFELPKPPLQIKMETH